MSLEVKNPPAETPIVSIVEDRAEAKPDSVKVPEDIRPIRKTTDSGIPQWRKAYLGGPK